MELLNTLYNLMSLVFVLGTICSMGLSLTMKQITGPLRNARFVIIALLANFVLPVLLALILIRVFSLDEPLAVGLLLVSLAAGAPGLPKTAVFAKIDTAAATALMVPPISSYLCQTIPGSATRTPSAARCTCPP